MNDLPMDMLPEEAEAAERARAEALAAKVDSFGMALCKKRREAIDGRSSSGIEDEWVKAEEAYQGIDDANRGEAQSGKPSGPNGGYINTTVKPAGRSTAFLNITRPYTDAAAAKVGDMLLPSDETPWNIKPTPIPNSMMALESLGMLQQPAPGLPYEPAGAAQQGGMPMDAGGQPMQPPQMAPMAAAVKSAMEEMRQKAEGAKRQIEDWLVECGWHGEARKMIEDCARLGTGVIKGPVPTKRISKKVTTEGGITQIVIEEKIVPESKAVSPWKCYPDPACGESIQDGSYFWEVDTITGRGLVDLIGLPGYIERQIKKVLEEGPGGKHKTDLFDPGNVKAKDEDQYEIWYGYVLADREDLEAAGVEVPEGFISVPAIVTMVNDCVIKAALSPMEKGDFPYDFMVWQRKPGVPWGTGIPRQIDTPQRMLNAATRNMLDNAGLSAGPQIVIRRDAITPADGVWNMTPRKFWFVNDGADVNAVNQAFMAVNIPTMQDQLMNIIQFALKMAEDVTGLPMLMQGQQGQAPDTVGGMQMMLNNASVVLRRIARLFDDRVVEPHIKRYFEWLMVYGEDDTIKGDMQIDARGSTALVERDIANQAIIQMGQLVLNPAFGIDPRKWIKEALQAQRIDPQKILMSDEEIAQSQQNMQPPPMPQVEAAKIRAEADLQKAQMQAQLEQALAQLKSQTEMQIAQMREQIGLQKIQADTDRDTVYVQAQMQRDQTTAQAKMVELELKRELAMLEYANKQQMTLEQVKARLAETAMKLNTTKELAGLKARADQMPTPPIEPPGRAPAGESFQR